MLSPNIVAVSPQDFGGCCGNTACCGCTYNPYFVFQKDPITALGMCFVRSDSTDNRFYYYDTVVQTTYTVLRLTIRSTPIVRTVINQVNLRFKFQKMITITNGRAIVVGGLRQVYGDIVTLQFNPLRQQVYMEIYTSVQWPYMLSPNIVAVSPQDDEGLNIFGFSIVGAAPYLTLLPNNTVGTFAYNKNCDWVENGICEQVWALNLTMPRFDKDNADRCEMRPSIQVKYNVGCQTLYDGNCTVGDVTRYADLSWSQLPFNDFCVNIVQDTTLTGGLYPFTTLIATNAGDTTKAVYNYVYGGPVFLRAVLAISSTTGVAPSFATIQLRTLRVQSGAGMSQNYYFNLSSTAEGLVYFDSNNQNWMAISFELNENTVTLANFDENQNVQVYADLRVTYKNINSPVSTGGFELEDTVINAADTSLSSQFFIQSSTSSSAAASSSMNVVAVAAGSAAGVVALTVLVAFLVHRRSVKQIQKTSSAAPIGKDNEEEDETEPSTGQHSAV